MKIRTTTDTGEWTTRRYLSLLGSVLIWAIVAVDAWYLWPTQLHGSTSMVIVSGRSMEPTYFTGDLVIARKTTPSIGDVIVYSPTGLGGSQIVHRIIGGNATDGWQMQGDNNDFIDPFTPKGSEVKGVVLVHYANFGRVTVLLLNPIIWALVLLTAIVLLVWWGGDTCEDEPTDDDKGGGSAGEADVPSDSTNTDGADASRAPPREEPSRAFMGDARSEGARISAPQTGGLRALLKPTRGIVATVVGVLALGFAVGPASASQLNVTVAGSVASMNYAHCANQTLAATMSGTASGGSYSSVSLSGIAAACQGKSTTVRLYSAAGALLATGTATPAAATATFATGSYVAANVSKVMVSVTGWPFTATWTGPVAAYACYPVNGGGAIPGGQTCTVSNISVTTWGSGSALYANVSMTITSSMNNALVVLDLSKGPFPGWTPQSVTGNSDFVASTLPAPAYQCSELPVIRFNRNLNNGSWILYFQMTTVPNNYGGNTAICN